MLVKPADARGAHGVRDVGRGVTPAEHAQLARLERLHADRQPVHAGVVQLAEPRRERRIRVRFGRDLRVVRQREARAHVADQRGDRFGRVRGRRAAAEEQRARLDDRRARELGAQRGEIARGARVVPRPLREVAVRADVRTKRQMNVDAGALTDVARRHGGCAFIRG